MSNYAKNKVDSLYFDLEVLNVYSEVKQETWAENWIKNIF